MKKVIQSARSKRNWARMFGVAAVFAVCLLNLQVNFNGGSGDVSLSSLSVTSRQVSAETTSGGLKVVAQTCYRNGSVYSLGNVCDWDGSGCQANSCR